MYSYTGLGGFGSKISHGTTPLNDKYLPLIGASHSNMQILLFLIQ